MALGRSDLIINVVGQECVIESKIYYDYVRFKKGKEHLAYYINSLGLNKGVYLVFVNKEVNNPFILENDEVIDGVEILTYLVKYDLERDFTEPKKATRTRQKK